jgi:L-threonylcarbamoyladenylate synthase
MEVRMETKVIIIDPDNIDSCKLSSAAKAIKDGRIVAFPTETVYGLGADALNPAAVEKIFIAKGRPNDNPLIVHIADKEKVCELTKDIPEKAMPLMDKLWPGPLTLVFRKNNIIPDAITAGLDTVAIRMPEHPVARELIRLAGVPVAAPSANISGRPSTTTAQHVINDLDGKIDIVVDAGGSRVGLESTVLDVTVDPPVLLRPGGITPEQLEEIIGHIDIDKTILGKVNMDNVPKSPGMKYKHYSPKAHVIIVKGSNNDSQIARISDMAAVISNEGKRVGICGTDQSLDKYSGYDAVSMGDRNHPETIASKLFSILREFDEKNVDVIIAEAVNESGVGLAIMNRMIKAAGYDIINAD